MPCGTRAADEAVVRFESTGETLRVTIRDNGAGFNPEHATRPTALGLLSMRERAAAIGATLSVAVATRGRHHGRHRATHGIGARRWPQLGPGRRSC